MSLAKGETKVVTEAWVDRGVHDCLARETMVHIVKR